MQMKSMAAVALATSGLITSIAAGDAVEWRVADGGNGHWYQVVVSATDISWYDARDRAVSVGGALASLTSEAENSWVHAQSIDVPGAWGLNGHPWWIFGPWIGGFRSSPGDQQWRWLSGESWSFTAWHPSQPDPWNDPNQTAISFGGGGPTAATWADTTPTSPVRSYIIEWSADCNNDGIVDYGQIKRGELPDFNGNNIPDCCEQGTACAVGSYPVEWRTEDGGNGHWYQMRDSGQTCFLNAIAYAESIRGYLMTANSHAEWTFASKYARAIGRPHFTIGAKGPQLAGGDWAWVTGEPWSYTAWGGQGGCDYGPYPNNGASGYYIWTAACGSLPDNVLPWDDGTSFDQCQSFFPVVLVEWSSDCNADGIVDYGQILSGSLADANANGVPDICESTLLVPSQYPTIQAAIDAVPANSQRTVQVAAGTYNESFSLNGKNVLVRGAAKNATILDGTGLITSIAKFTGGEPATAGVESLVFRNGTVGSRFTPATTFTVGGAIYATNTAAHIAICRFENCRADYGGAVYQLNGLFAWNNCVFVDNIANDEGGAVLVYNCTGSVSGSSFAGNRCGVSGPGSGSAFKAVGSNGDGESVVLDSCAFTGGYATSSGAAVEFYENIKYHPGVMRIVNTSITGNISGEIVLNGAAGLRVLGRMQSCVLATGTNICNNTPKNVAGPYFIEGAVTVCGCAADITDDGVVNGGDLGVMLSNWGLDSSSGVGDISHDGVINGVDLAELLARWGTCQ